MTRAAGFAAALALTLGCAARSAAPHIGVTGVPEGEAAANEPRRHAESEPPPDIVQRSALPISGLRAKDGKELSDRQLFDELSRFDAVCIGESHDDPHHHYAELALLGELARRTNYRGEELGVGFEMFQGPFQGALDAYGHGASDESELLHDSEYEARWGFPFAYYRPLLELGRARRLPLLALNARRELTRSIAREGLEKLDPELARELPELDFRSPAHRQAFEQMMQGHPKGHGSPENMYAAQVVWDETMAEHAAAFLAGYRPVRKLLIVAGLAHCAKPGVPSRIERRTALRVAAVVPSVGRPVRFEGFDYALVMTPPNE